MNAPTPSSGYQHTQTGPLHFLLYAIGLAMLVAAWFARGEPVALWVLSIVGVLMWVFAFSFHHMTVEDEIDSLAIRFGPLPLLHKRIAYDRITSVESGRTSLVDGWGIHYVPGRGWTYNIWGFGCAKLTLGGKVIRVGSDDVENLVRFLQTRINDHG